MQELVTPKQVARAIGVSESSLKRWCDRGLIETVRTAGGHRRLRVSSVIQYLREAGYVLTDPSALGIPISSGRGERIVSRGRDRLRDALLAGDEILCRQIVFDLYLAKHSLESICDDVVASAFGDIGDLWACQQTDIYQERRACEITQRLFHELRMLLPMPVTEWSAIGGTLEGDPYTLPTTMVELVLRDLGWNATSLGPSLPAASMLAAVRELRPRLVWLSISVIPDRQRFVRDCCDLYHALAASEISLALGGSALNDEVRDQIKYNAYCANMTQLRAFAAALRGRGETET